MGISCLGLLTAACWGIFMYKRQALYDVEADIAIWMADINGEKMEQIRQAARFYGGVERTVNSLQSTQTLPQLPIIRGYAAGIQNSRKEISLYCSPVTFTCVRLFAYIPVPSAVLRQSGGPGDVPGRFWG